jgi:hypothetical protein
MWVSWVVARRLVLGLMLVALAFAGLELEGPSEHELGPTGCAPFC